MYYLCNIIVDNGMLLFEMMLVAGPTDFSLLYIVKNGVFSGPLGHASWLWDNFCYVDF